MKYLRIGLDEERIDKDLWEWLRKKANGSHPSKAAYLALREAMILSSFNPSIAEMPHNCQETAKKLPQIVATEEDPEIDWDLLDEIN